MTYSNPRLKHVKRIKKICTELEITGAMPGFLWQILHQCKLLLETKKAKKRKEKCNCGGHVCDENDICIHCFLPKHYYTDKQTIKILPDQREESKKVEKPDKDINVPIKLDYEKMDKEQAVLETLEDLAFRVKRYADHGKKPKFIKIKREDVEGNYDFVDPKEESKDCECNNCQMNRFGGAGGNTAHTPDPKKESKGCCGKCVVLGVRDYKIGGVWNHMELPTGVCKNENCECHSTTTESKEKECNHFVGGSQFNSRDGIIGDKIKCEMCGEIAILNGKGGWSFGNSSRTTPSRSEELEKVIKTRINVGILFTDEDLHGLSEAILSKFTLTPIK